MNKEELTERIAQRTKLPKSKVKEVLLEFKNLIVEVVNKGGEVSLRNFGKFYAGESKGRIYRNLITKRRFFSQPKKYVKFALFKNFKFSIK